MWILEDVQLFDLNNGVHKLEISKCTGFGRDIYIYIIHLFCQAKNKV